MKTEAAVLVELGGDLQIADLEIPPLAPGQVLVKIELSGVCHTQLSEARGRRGPDAWLPHCLGHEGVGRVVDCDAGGKVSVDDRVVLTWIQGEGRNAGGAQYAWADGRGGKVNAGAVTTFQRHAVVSENRLVSLPDGLDDDLSPLLGCAAPTGFGAVLNTAAVRGDETVVILGVGGVGACAVLAAAHAGCPSVVAVDVNPEKLQVATRLGATQVVLADDGLAESLESLVPGGFDVAIEATGQAEVMSVALERVRPRGGLAVIVGNAPSGQLVTIDPQQFNQGKRLFGTWGGDSVPDRDVPRFAEILRDERARLTEVVGPRYSLGDVNRALLDLEQGRVLRPIIDPWLDNGCGAAH